MYTIMLKVYTFKMYTNTCAQKAHKMYLKYTKCTKAHIMHWKHTKCTESAYNVQKVH